MRAIPPKLLVHSCTLKKQAGLDRNRNPTYTETVLKRVRIGATFRVLHGSIGEARADTMTLIIDAENTSYETAAGEQTEAVLPAENDAVEWQGHSFTVRGITPCHAQGNAPHHWEVTLE